MDANLTLKPIDVSCIIINFNTTSYTLACLQSIIDLEESAINYELVVIDNASEAESYKELKQGILQLNNDRIKLFRSKKNLGFGGGNMLGVQMASPCKYYAFINNDTLHLKKNTLKELMQFMESNPSIGISSPQMLDQDKNFRVTIDHFSSLGREILRRPLLEKLFPKIYLNRKKFYESPTRVQYVQGSYMFTKASAFNHIGGFDDNMFLYYEESDVSYRLLKQLNLSTYLYPQLSYVHYKSASTKKGIAIKIEQKISLLYYTKKHHGFIQHRILLSYYIIRYFFSSLFKPRYWKLFSVLVQGAPLSKSLKQQQQLHEID
ncbi:MAG: glycosyltransferase family 2 protein [Mesonia sp.]|uniref:glycosyltransferase family 2 protein n=1 Tax=Mesonia sp. TaxID=1960830 RepID=UPI003F960F7E